jgi:hypothetical protein
LLAAERIGWHPDRLAEELGEEQDTVRDWIDGTESPDLRNFLRIGRKLAGDGDQGAMAEYLLGRRSTPDLGPEGGEGEEAPDSTEPEDRPTSRGSCVTLTREEIKHITESDGWMDEAETIARAEYHEALAETIHLFRFEADTHIDQATFRRFIAATEGLAALRGIREGRMAMRVELDLLRHEQEREAEGRGAH